MSPSPTIRSRAWLLVPFVVAALVLLGAARRSERLQVIAGLPGWSVDAPAADAGSPTGYAGGQRRLIVPEHNRESYEWIQQTQHALATGEWRPRQVAYDNAPSGRATHLALPYRVWLGACAWTAHALNGEAPGAAVETAAGFADPLLHALIIVGAGLLAGFAIGPAAGVAVALAAGVLFPFAASFTPGAPEARSLTLLAAAGALLPLVAGLTRPLATRRWLAVAGAFGGFALALEPAFFAPLLPGIALGALAFARLRRPVAADQPVPAWRWWGLAAATVAAALYVAERGPGPLDRNLALNHPLWAVGLLGLGELLHRADAWLARGLRPSGLGWLAGFAALGAVAAVPVALAAVAPHGLFAADLRLAKLTQLVPVAAPDTLEWFTRDGLNAATLLLSAALLLALGALAPLLRRATAPGERALVAFAAAPVLVALPLALAHLRWWTGFELALLSLLLAAGAVGPAGWRRLWPWTVAALALPGVTLLLPPPRSAWKNLSEPELTGLVERDLAHWLRARTDRADLVLLAPPDTSASLAFYGGFRGVGSLAWENKDGLAAALRIAGATSKSETQSLLEQRGVTHLVLPSWDPFLDEYVRSGRGAGSASNLATKSFLAALRQWNLPPWLRPVPYNLAGVPGFDQQSAVVLEVVDEQEAPLAASRLAEYFLELGRTDYAASLRADLQQHPTDLGALVALAQIEAARRDTAAFAPRLDAVLTHLRQSGDEGLYWDRRLNLATLLAQSGRLDEARDQLERCLAELTPELLRSVTPGTVFRLQLLARRLGRPIPEGAARELARRLTAPAQRERL